MAYVQPTCHQRANALRAWSARNLATYIAFLYDGWSKAPDALGPSLYTLGWLYRLERLYARKLSRELVLGHA